MSVPSLKLPNLDIESSEAPLPDVLNMLRFYAMDCRSSARLDVFQACKMLALDSTVAADAFATALVRTMPHVMDRSIHFRRPGSPPSFDETWLMRVIERSKCRDDISLTFLIVSRVPEGRRYAFLHLVNGLADAVRRSKSKPDKIGRL